MPSSFFKDNVLQTRLRTGQDILKARENLNPAKSFPAGDHDFMRDEFRQNSLDRCNRARRRYGKIEFAVAQGGFCYAASVRSERKMPYRLRIGGFFRGGNKFRVLDPIGADGCDMNTPS